MPYFAAPLVQRLSKAKAALGTAALGALLAGSVLLMPPRPSVAATVSPRAAFAYSHVPSVVRGLSPLRETAGTELITIDFTLKPRNQEQIQPLLEAISDPRSLRYGHYLTQAEYRARFAPTKAQADAVVAYAKAQGLSVTGVSTSRMLVRATGTAAQMESAFGVKLHDYVSPDPRDNGRIFHSPSAEPTIDASVAPLLTGIVGLSNAAVPHNFSHSETKSAQRAAAALLHPGSVVGTGNGGHLSPYDIASLYSLNQALSAYSGQGQVLGLLELCSYNSADVAPFESYYPQTNTFPDVIPISVDGYNTATTPDPNAGEGEVTLDIDMMLDVAYNASQIRVYEAPNSDTGLLAEIDAMANDSTPANVISCSWGNTEKYSTQAQLQTEASSFQQLALQGQTFCADAGDNDAYDTGYTSDGVTVQDPSSQPNVVCVGGTDINDSQTSPTSPPTLVSQTSWFDASDTREGPAGTGGGGGVSSVWSIPQWQVGAFTPNANPQGSETMRNTPDVSMYGDYDTGYYDTYEADLGGWVGENGTSAATPLWASLIADINSARTTVGASALGMATPQIYALAESGSYSNDFYDVADNSNNGYYNAVAGYDNSTGWGTPLNGSYMIFDLAEENVDGISPLSDSTSSLTPGEEEQFTIYLPQPAAENETYAFSSTDQNALPVPATMTIQQGYRNNYFNTYAGTLAPGTSEEVTVTATLNGYSDSQVVTVYGPAATLSSVSLNPSSVVGGQQNSTGTVTLDGPAPSGGEVIGLSSNDASTTVPANVTVPEGATTATFTATTSAVESSTSVTITASDPQSDTQTASLTVNPATLDALTLAASSVQGAGTLVGNRVYLSGYAAANTPVKLASSNPGVASVPGTEVVLAGSNSHSFMITTSAVSNPTQVTITATSGGVTETQNFTVNPTPVPLASVTVAAGSVEGGATLTGNRVALTGAANADTPVKLTSSNPAVASVPSTEIVLAGSKTHSFVITASTVATATQVTITATSNGVTKMTTLTVTP